MRSEVEQRAIDILKRLVEQKETEYGLDGKTATSIALDAREFLRDIGEWPQEIPLWEEPLAVDLSGPVFVTYQDGDGKEWKGDVVFSPSR